MKILLLIPDGYTLLNTIKSAFENLDHEIQTLNYPSFFNNWQNRIITKTIGLPHTFKNKIKIHERYRQKINSIYLNHVVDNKPDLVFVYNDQYLSYETAKEIRKISKLAFILGDNPFFFHNRPTNELGMYLEADYVFSCDSFITESFKKAGQPNVSEIYFGYDPEICYPKKTTDEQKRKFSSDIVMVGRLYPSILASWTYKRLCFYNQFRKLDLKIYGHGWRKYQQDFPELLNKVTDLDHHLTFDEINTIVSCCKVYPIDANPGIVNGIHLRVFDCIGSEILPIVESTKDLESVFKDVEIPIIRDYSRAEELAKYYIQNDVRREQLKKELKRFVDANYTPQKAVFKIMNKVFNL